MGFSIRGLTSVVPGSLPIVGPVCCVTQFGRPNNRNPFLWEVVMVSGNVVPSLCRNPVLTIQVLQSAPVVRFLFIYYRDVIPRSVRSTHGVIIRLVHVNKLGELSEVIMGNRFH